MKVVKFLACAIPLSLAAFGNAAAHPSVTKYCLAGDLVMKARLTISGSHYVLEAWNVMPDNSQTLEIHADGTYRRIGSTPIRFIDNYNNRGRGSFFATKSTFHLDIERVKASPEGLNIGRNYGSYDLKSDGCKWDWQ